MPIDYRGANVEDLQLQPAFTVDPNTLLNNALELAYEREFSYLPVVSSSKKLLGFLTVDKLLKSLGDNNKNNSNNIKVKDCYTKFSKKKPFFKITPDTPLEKVDEFFSMADDNSNADDFGIVTDYDRKFVLGVVTKQDLEHFITRRPSL